MTQFTPLAPYVAWDDAARSIGVCRKTLARYAAEPGSGLRSVKVGGRRMFRREDIAAWLLKNERQAPSRRTA